MIYLLKPPDSKVPNAAPTIAPISIFMKKRKHEAKISYAEEFLNAAQWLLTNNRLITVIWDETESKKGNTSLVWLERFRDSPKTNCFTIKNGKVFMHKQLTKYWNSRLTIGFVYTVNGSGRQTGWLHAFRISDPASPKLCFWGFWILSPRPLPLQVLATRDW